MYHHHVPRGILKIFCYNVTFCFTKAILIFFSLTPLLDNSVDNNGLACIL